MLLAHKKARFNYELTDTFDAGIELFGHEVKALKEKKGSLEGAFIVLRGDEAFIVGMHVPPFQVLNTPSSYDPYRTRKLLLTKKEIKELTETEHQKGLTIVPIIVYKKGRYIKVKLAIARGKKRFDKRETIKKRDIERELGRTLKR